MSIDSKRYYESQLSRVKVDGEYKPIVKVISPEGGESTKYMDINRDSALVLVKWLEDNFINKP